MWKLKIERPSSLGAKYAVRLGQLYLPTNVLLSYSSYVEAFISRLNSF